MQKIILTIFLFASSLQAQTAIYRSIQPGNTSAIWTSGGSITLTISGSTATFSSAAPDTVGVGVAIQYDSSNAGAVNAICFIHGRTSSTVFTVKRFNGGTPASCSGDTDWSLFHAYTGISTARTLGENTGISATVRNFDISPQNIASRNETWRFACYNGRDSLGVAGTSWTGWTTSNTCRLKWYTPAETDEVGTSQRHNGTYGSGYKMYRNHSNVSFLFQVNALSPNPTDHFDIEGLQFKDIGTGAQALLVLMAISGNGNVSNCIFVGSDSISTSNLHQGIRMTTGASGSYFKIWNNIFYNLKARTTFADAAIWNETDTPCYASHNTIQQCEIGIGAGAAASIVSYNNIVQSNNSFYGNVTGDYNIGSSGDAPGDSSYSNAATFADAGNDDYRLAVTDAYARNRGLDLTSDPTLPVTDDIVGTTRPEGLTTDRGAHEYTPDPGDSGIVRRRGVARNWPF